MLQFKIHSEKGKILKWQREWNATDRSRKEKNSELGLDRAENNGTEEEDAD